MSANQPGLSPGATGEACARPCAGRGGARRVISRRGDVFYNRGACRDDAADSGHCASHARSRRPSERATTVVHPPSPVIKLMVDGLADCPTAHVRVNRHWGSLLKQKRWVPGVAFESRHIKLWLISE